MGRKKVINWPDIKLRWLVGESPPDIAKDYASLKPRAIVDKAYRDKWRDDKAIIDDQVVENTISVLTEFKSTGLRIATKLLKQFETELDAEHNKMLMSPFIRQGMTVNPYVKQALTEAIKNGKEDTDESEAPKEAKKIEGLDLESI
jgi:hypothetical protein